MNNKIVGVSGGFDPLTIGHIRLFKEAEKLGYELIVILNNDNWLRAKKRVIFMPEEERKEIIEAIGVVDKVVLTSHSKDPKDMSVSKELRKLKIDTFANGGDRKKCNIPEEGICKMVFGVGGDKIQSSSWLLDKYVKARYGIMGK